MNCKFVEHRFGPNDTIIGVIRLYNAQKIIPSIRERLLTEFEARNGHMSPKVGSTAQIPVMAQFMGTTNKTRMAK